MAKQRIVTNLLGRTAIYWRDEHGGICSELAAETCHTGEIVSVYLDPDGGPKYTVVGERDDGLIDTWFILPTKCPGLYVLPRKDLSGRRTEPATC
jgi:hypothetical protein